MFRVAVLVESSGGHGRNVCRGIARYAHECGSWSVYFSEGSLSNTLPEWFSSWQGEGILARVLDPRLLAVLEQKGVPLIDLVGQRSVAAEVSVAQDHEAIARMAAEFFLSNGFEHFGFCGFPGMPFSDHRQGAFVEELARRGRRCEVYPGSMDQENAPRMGLVEAGQIARWLENAPKPMALLACNDTRGLQVLNACREYGIKVPEAVAVLGIDNDDVLCELTEPPMSSIQGDSQGIGYHAARLLDEWMKGQFPSQPQVRFAPRSVFERASTDLVALEDPLVVQAMRWMRLRLEEGLQAKQMANELGVSRRTLDAHFSQALGRTFKQVQLEERLRRARQLLVEGKVSVTSTARRTGFRTVAHFVEAFRLHYGQTPGQIARQSAVDTPGSMLL